MRSKVTVYKFGATWCGPCKVLDTKFYKVSQEFPEVTVIALDVEQDAKLAKQHKIRSVPTVIFLDEGKEVERLVGAVLTGPLRKAFKTLQERLDNVTTDDQ